MHAGLRCQLVTRKPRLVSVAAITVKSRRSHNFTPIVKDFQAAPSQSHASAVRGQSISKHADRLLNAQKPGGAQSAHLAYPSKRPWLRHVQQRDSDVTAAQRLQEEIAAANVEFQRSLESQYAVDRLLVTIYFSIQRSKLDDDIKKLIRGVYRQPIDVLGFNAAFSPTECQISMDSHTPIHKRQEMFKALGAVMEESISPRIMNHSSNASDNTWRVVGSFSGRSVVIYSSGLKLRLHYSITPSSYAAYVKDVKAMHPTLAIVYRIMKQSLALQDIGTGQEIDVTDNMLLHMLIVSYRIHDSAGELAYVGYHLLQFLRFWSTFDVDGHHLTHLSYREAQASDIQTGEVPRLSARALGQQNYDISRVIDKPISAWPVLVPTDAKLPYFELHGGKHNKKSFMLASPIGSNVVMDIDREVFKRLQLTFSRMLSGIVRDTQGWDDLRSQGLSPTRDTSVLRTLLEGDYCRLQASTVPVAVRPSKKVRRSGTSKSIDEVEPRTGDRAAEKQASPEQDKKLPIRKVYRYMVD